MKPELPAKETGKLALASLDGDEPLTVTVAASPVEIAMFDAWSTWTEALARRPTSLVNLLAKFGTIATDGTKISATPRSTLTVARSG